MTPRTEWRTQKVLYIFLSTFIATIEPSTRVKLLLLYEYTYKRANGMRTYNKTKREEYRIKRNGTEMPKENENYET